MSRWLNRSQIALVSLPALLVCLPLTAQVRLGSDGAAVHIVNSDMAVLEAQDVRKDLVCTVTPDKPVLGFDLRFHGGYDITLPLEDIAGDENLLTVLFRVTPSDGNPSYFVQHFKVPRLDDDAKGEATLSGQIDLGEGSYHVDWLMRDRGERVCSFYWDMDATLAAKDKQIELAIAPNTVQQSQSWQFNQEPPVERSQTGRPLSIKILVNFAPQDYNSAALRPFDTAALVSILRRISMEPEFGKFSVVAFNMQEQRVVYRQASADTIDFPALGKAIDSIKLGVVDRSQLANKHSDTDFLTGLIRTEMSGADHPDALVFAGPKVMLDDAVPQETLKPLARVDYPVFYMNYALNPAAVPWKDSISRAIRVFRGTEFTITRPRDLWFAVTDMVSRIVKSKHGPVIVSNP